MDKLRVGIVGAGNIAQSAHLPAYLKRDDVIITGIADLNYERAKQAAEKFGIPRAFDSADALLAGADVDFVDVCVWNRSHAPVTISAARAGKHVLCEKPMALNISHALDMQSEIEKAGVIFMLAVPSRYAGETQLLREMIDKGKLGDIYYAKCAYIRRRGTPLGWFTDTQKSGGGPVIDIGVHCIDRTWYLMGCPKPTRVSAATSNKIGDYQTKGVERWRALDDDVTAFDTEDSACGVVHFENGAALMFEVSWALNAPEQAYTQICGTLAGATLDPLTIYGEECGYLTNNQPRAAKLNNFEVEIDHFINCVRTGARPISDLEQAVAMQRILEGIYVSAKSGKEVYI